MNGDYGHKFPTWRLLRFKVQYVWNRLSSRAGFRDKTLWDWMGLLIVPIFIAGAAGIFSFMGLRSEEQRAIAQQKIETDRVRQDVLEQYILNMTELLDRGLAASESSSFLRQVARANTLSTIPQLDSSRNRILIRFLSEANLISKGSVALLRDADLRGADLSGVYLRSADLNGAKLSSADLSDADMSRISLSYATMAFTKLTNADMVRANLEGANLSGADLSGANLIGANMSDVDLRGASASYAELGQADILMGSIMPDNEKMTKELWDKVKATAAATNPSFELVGFSNQILPGLLPPDNLIPDGDSLPLCAPQNLYVWIRATNLEPPVLLNGRLIPLSEPDQVRQAPFQQTLETALMWWEFNQPLPPDRYTFELIQLGSVPVMSGDVTIRC
jgi:hypothetical protein